MEAMKLFRRRDGEQGGRNVDRCPACGSDHLEVLVEQRVSVVGDELVTATPTRAAQRMRTVALCQTCGLVSDLSTAWPSHVEVGLELGRVCDLEEAIFALRRAARRRSALTRVVDAGRLWAHPDRGPLAVTSRHWFTAGVLARTLRRAGMRVDAIQLDADGGLLAEVLDGPVADAPFSIEAGIAEDAEAVRSYFPRRREAVVAIRERLRQEVADGGTPVVWGATPSTVALLDELGPEAPLEAVVDDGRERIGGHLIGGGHRVIAADDIDVKPTLVILPDLAATRAAGAAFDTAGRTPELL